MPMCLGLSFTTLENPFISGKIGHCIKSGQNYLLMGSGDPFNVTAYKLLQLSKLLRLEKYTSSLGFEFSDIV